MFLMERYQNKVRGKGKFITKALNRAKLYIKSVMIMMMIIIIIKIMMKIVKIIIIIIVMIMVIIIRRICIVKLRHFCNMFRAFLQQ